ncbi:HNH endonuclease signature motif containing protein [Pseudomonas aeruginosa]|uniref:HNH endonuclease signature motif containing protein n=1 Tax=Pseudomonas aeruginosa TaxID=287 RepID=UPI001C529575|nr:HNH endonuclease signature motif containing protein [Pseudomonas aeruginosa]MBW1093510.1 HNH endonuclease [Pseudomonas aeruginosa]HBO3572498.1 HNH endonuclease [Pseudomonas aeruginosa]HBO5687051.1 HNH endonuclease [Pseudomonas aeruginosa]HEJ1563282.1 HNH endonuclease [Pseudomonas aeruginosa]
MTKPAKRKLKTIKSRLQPSQLSRIQSIPLSVDRRITGRKLQDRRLRVWAHNPCCVMCGKLCEFPGGFELDHKVPLFKGGEDTEENCQVLCSGPDGCHAKKTNTDLGRRSKLRVGIDGWPAVDELAEKP